MDLPDNRIIDVVVNVVDVIVADGTILVIALETNVLVVEIDDIILFAIY